MSRLSTWWRNLSEKTQDLYLAILVTLVALAPRLPGLNVFLTADEPKSWFGRSIQFLDALARADWAATFDSPAPGVTTMWAGSIGLLLEYARQGFPGPLTDFLATVPFDPLDPAILPLIRLPIVLVAALTAVLTYLWGRAVLGRTAALLAALLLALDPFLLALTRILGHDGLVALFMWLSLVAFLRASPLSKSPRETSNRPSPHLFNRRLLLISGALGGLAFLTKYPSLFLGAFIALVMLIFYGRQPQPWPRRFKQWAIDVALWSVAAGLVFVLLWPAMWVDPVGNVITIANDALRASSNPHQKGSFFLGQPVADPGASFYPLVTLFKTTPVLWLGWLLLATNAILALFRKKDSQLSAKPPGETSHKSQFATRNSQFAILILLAFAFAFALLVTLGGKKQDRYILPSFPALAALAALGFTTFKLIITNYELRITNYFIPIIIAIQAILIFPTYPYYFSYYNSLLGGGPAAAKTMIVGWGEGLDRAARWLNSQPHAADTEVVAWYSTTFEPFFAGHAIYKIEEEKISRSPKPGLAADYVILYVNQVQRDLPSLGALQFFRAEPPVHTVTLGGIDYAWIYPSVKMQRVLSNEARLVGQAELLGYNLLDASGQRLSANQFSADQTPTLQLYWEWKGKSPDEPIQLGLVDFNGQPWGQVQFLNNLSRVPFEQWQEGMVSRDDFKLTLYPGTPPGDYYLKAWIDRPATGERVGDFPLLLEDVHLKVTRPATPPAPDNLSLAKPLDLPLQGGAVTLLGFTFDHSPNSTNSPAPWQPTQNRRLILYWQANDATGQNDPVSLALVDSKGIVRAEWVDLPAAGNFPTDQWQAGDIIRDPWTLTLPPHVPPGPYQLTAALGQESPLELLTVTIEGRPRQFDAPPPDLPLAATFGPSIELLGLQSVAANESTLTATPGQPLAFSLIWQATNLIDADYTVTVQLLDGERQVHAQRDSEPLDGTAPTTSWAVGELLPDAITLDIPAQVGPPPHQLLIALYRFETGERLLLPNGADHLTIPVELGD